MIKPSDSDMRFTFESDDIAAPDLTLDLVRVARRVLWMGISLGLAFLLLDYVMNYRLGAAIGPLRRLFNITREDSAASWFGATQTLLTGLTALIIYFVARARSASPRGRGWAVVATLFIYMAVDDGVQIHERLGSAFYALSRAPGSVFERFPSYPWQLVFVPVFGLLGLYISVFLWRELRDAGLRWLVIAALSLQAFAVGLDFIEGLMPGHPWNIYRLIAEFLDAGVGIPEDALAPAFGMVRHFGKACEETVEMLAITLFWYVFLRHLGASNAGVRLAFVSASGER